jgi:hypothetical protein
LHEKHVLGAIRQSPDYTPDLLLDAWRDYRARRRTRSSFTVTQLCEAYYARQLNEKRSGRTLNDDNRRLKKLATALGTIQANDCTAGDPFQYLETIPPGTNPHEVAKETRARDRKRYGVPIGVPLYRALHRQNEITTIAINVGIAVSSQCVTLPGVLYANCPFLGLT